MYVHLGDGQYRGKANHPRCNCMRPAKTIRGKNKYSLCVVLEDYARKDEPPHPPHAQTSTGFNMGVVALRSDPPFNLFGVLTEVDGGPITR
jgi:hypothetical protein